MFVLLNRIQLMEGRKISQQTLVKHILLKHLQRLVAMLLVSSSLLVYLSLLGCVAA